MRKVFYTWEQRNQELTEAIDSLNEKNLEARIGSFSCRSLGWVHTELYVQSKKVGDIFYIDKEPRCFMRDDSFKEMADKILAYLNSKSLI